MCYATLQCNQCCGTQNWTWVLHVVDREPCSLSPGVESDPGAKGREEPHPAGTDAPGGGGAQPLGWSGTCGHTWQRLHTNLPLQASLLYLLVVTVGWGGRFRRDFCSFFPLLKRLGRREVQIGDGKCVCAERRNEDTVERKYDEVLLSPHSTFCEATPVTMVTRSTFPQMWAFFTVVFLLLFFYPPKVPTKVPCRVT